jgi:charged multivesicular body protein 7
MSRDKPSLSYSPTTNTIKFTSPTSTSPEEITETDISIAQIKSLQLSLDLAIPPLEERLASLTQAVRDAVQKQQLSNARSLLKSKKLIENTLEKRRANLLQMEESLHAIDNASDNVAIIQSMQKSAAIMKTLNESVGGIEGVERITDALRDEMAVAEDIGKIIAEPGAAAVDEGDVEDEFEALVAEEKKKIAEKERVEREKREAVERAEREKREKEEADATSKRLAELEAFEKRKDEERKQAEALSARLAASEPSLHETKSVVEEPSQAVTVPTPLTDEEKALSRSMEMLGNMSLDETRPSITVNTEQKAEKHKEKEPMLAS